MFRAGGVCVCDMLGNKAAQKMCMIMGKNGYIVLSLVKILLFYPNFSQKYVLFVKSFNHKIRKYV